MAAAAEGAGDNAITGINVTPMVDILLVVLIIFMATAPIIAKRAIHADLPQAARHDRAATKAVAVVLNAQRELFMAGDRVSLPELASRLAREVALQENVHVTLSADRAIPYGEVVVVLDAARGAGVKKIGLEVRPK